VYVVEEKARMRTLHTGGGMDDIQGVEADHGRERGGFYASEGKLRMEHGTTWKTGMGQEDHEEWEEWEEEKVLTPIQTPQNVGGGEGRGA
jgi:hypothetical protein